MKGLVYKKSIELPKVFLHLVEDDIIVLKFKDKVILEIEDAKQIDQLIFDELVHGKPFVALIDATDIDSTITHEARDFFSSDELIIDIRKAQAIVVNSLPTKLLANFYMNFHRPINPIKIFNDFSAALQWINQFRNY